ncbi:peptidase, S9A/B/C family, catalytic domain protein [Porphyromonas asaccharolytica PR426713P-I]|uniref:S9 family peptidase n=1 Tax=Porphyromonas asaccharolytica TaxID=28123 RepID=UPI0001EB26ED|nr:S9 family peptidase [Porphyromonas asaccharolytica]EFR33962.1 peptidase, S9A/B/C family, catalytic domain protein [Porphyromonas asaccharolytica PR426713P-I]
MRTRTLFTTLILLCSLTLVAQQQREITLPEVTSGAFAARGAGNGFRSLPDGKHYTLISDDYQRIVKYEYATGRAVDTLFDIAKARECDLQAIWDYDIAPSGHHILIYTDIKPIYRRSYTMRATHYDVRRNLCEPLTEGEIMIPTFSPDGRMVAFVRDNNIYIKKFDFNSEVQVTTDGKRNEVINGTTDWVYEEEFSTTRLMEWSPESDFLAFVRSDESQVKAYSMPIYGDDLYPTDYVYKYPKVGEQNSTVSLHLYNLELKRIDRVELPLDADGYIPRIVFTGWGSDLAAVTLNRLQNDLKVYRINPKSRTPRLTLREQDPRYINNEFINSMRFVPDGIVMLSERDGSTQLYKYGTNGALQQRLTQGEWDIINFYGCDSEGNVYYQAADETPTQRRVLKTTPRGKTTVLAGEAGINRASFTQDYSYFINSYSNAKTPTITTIRTAKEGKVIRTLEDNAQLVAKLKGYDYNDKEFFTIEVAPGRTLHGWMIRPPHFDASKRYPTVMHQYSGPDSQEVLDQFYIGWEYALAQAGYVVVCVDGRGTGGRGTEWRKCTYRELGLRESSDQIAAAEALPKQFSYIDGDRIAIFGWSYGGFNALMSLCRGKAFRAGVAVAPVTDWRFYDTVYTERFMATPQVNNKGYDASSVLPIAHNLHGDLLVIHGTADDNVHLQNTMRLATELVKADIPFEMATYTDKDHSIYGGNNRQHLYSRIIDFLDRKLK